MPINENVGRVCAPNNCAVNPSTGTLFANNKQTLLAVGRQQNNDVINCWCAGWRLVACWNKVHALTFPKTSLLLHVVLVSNDAWYNQSYIYFLVTQSESFFPDFLILYRYFWILKSMIPISEYWYKYQYISIFCHHK